MLKTSAYQAYVVFMEKQALGLGDLRRIPKFLRRLPSRVGKRLTEPRLPESGWVDEPIIRRSVALTDVPLEALENARSGIDAFGRTIKPPV